MFEVASGKEAIKAAERRQAYELLALRSGSVVKTIPLNGGSDTRRATADYWREYAAALGIRCEVLGGCIVRLGDCARAPPSATEA